MAGHSCCNEKVRAAGETAPRPRKMTWTKLIVPTAVLVLIPKCPMCVAAYIALATGFTISLPVATWIRTGLLAASLCTITYLSLRLTIRALARRKTLIQLAKMARPGPPC